jgi:peptidoglycan hydrolase-like protein with peptidoglycan-binding domain
VSAGPGFYRDLYGPASDPGDRYPMSGDDVVAVKRVLSRAGFLPWSDFTNTYGEQVERACAQFQTSVGIMGEGGGPPRGHYGKKTHDALRDARRAGHEDEWAWDDYSAKLYAETIVPNTPPSFKFKRDLWGPGYDPHDRYPMSGDDCLAVKRALSRAGFIPWQEFTNTYGTQAENGCRAFQESVGITGGDGGAPRGHYGESTHAKLLKAKAAGKHEWAFDARSIELYKGYESGATGGDARSKALDHLERRVGYTEQPSGSNCDNRSDGIRTAQDHTAGGGTWLRYQPWCGCWCYYALETAGVQNIDSSLASVASIEDYARQGAKCYRGWTTDRSKVKPGDLVVIGGYGVHVETVRGFSGSTTLTFGGNTSSGSSGSQSNGGGAYARSRSPSEVRGYALVRYPGE